MPEDTGLRRIASFNVIDMLTVMPHLCLLPRAEQHADEWQVWYSVKGSTSQMIKSKWCNKYHGRQ